MESMVQHQEVRCPRCRSRRVSLERHLIDPHTRQRARESAWLNGAFAAFIILAVFVLIAEPAASQAAALLGSVAAETAQRLALALSAVVGIAYLIVAELGRRRKVDRSLAIFRFCCAQCGHRWGLRGAAESATQEEATVAEKGVIRLLPRSQAFSARYDWRDGPQRQEDRAWRA